jgi:hypothetical protein
MGLVEQVIGIGEIKSYCARNIGLKTSSKAFVGHA